MTVNTTNTTRTNAATATTTPKSIVLPQTLTVKGKTFADLESGKGFEMLKRAFETDYASGDYADTLTALATAAAASVVRRLCDPDARQAATRDRISTAGQNPAMLTLRREVYDDTESLAALRDLTDRATRYTFNDDGDPVREVVDKAADRAAATLAAARLGDGCDLVQTAAVALLEMAGKYADLGAAWLDSAVTVRRLAKRTYADRDAVATWKDATTTPIQEVYRAIRRYVDATRAVQTDPRNGYAYIADLAADPDGDALEVIYKRVGKYADLGGYAANGRHADTLAGAPSWYASGDGCGDNYTTGAATVERADAILAALNLTDREKTVLALRMRGMSTTAIAARLGIGEKTVRRAVADMQDRAAACGFAPSGWSADNRKGDPARPVEQYDTTTGATVDTFESAAAAALVTGVNKGSISAAAQGKRKTAGGFGWRYVG